jgi:hypothetical protein
MEANTPHQHHTLLEATKGKGQVSNINNNNKKQHSHAAFCRLQIAKELNNGLMKTKRKAAATNTWY